MKTIGVYNYDEKTYAALIERLRVESIELKPLQEGQTDNSIDLYVFNVDTEQDFEKIKLDKPFIIISSVHGPKFIIKSGKLGALDYMSKPFIDMEVTVKRIQRLLTNAEGKQGQKNNSHDPKYDKLIDIELKRADRGKYPITLASVMFEARFNRETLIRVIDKLKTVLRESDSCIPFSDQNIIIILPFADKPGSDIVAKKISELLERIGHKANCICATYPEDGQDREAILKKIKEDPCICE